MLFNGDEAVFIAQQSSTFPVLKKIKKKAKKTLQ